MPRGARPLALALARALRLAALQAGGCAGLDAKFANCQSRGSSKQYAGPVSVSPVEGRYRRVGLFRLGSMRVLSHWQIFFKLNGRGPPNFKLKEAGQARVRVAKFAWARAQCRGGMPVVPHWHSG